MTSGTFLIHSMLLHSRDTREIGIEPGGHAAARLLQGISFGYRAIDSEVAPGVGNLVIVEFNDNGAALAGFRMYEVAGEFHGYPSAIGDDNNTESKLCWRVDS